MGEGKANRDWGHSPITFDYQKKEVEVQKESHTSEREEEEDKTYGEKKKRQT